MQYLKKCLACALFCTVILFCNSHAQTTIGDFRKLPDDQKAKLVTDSLSALLHFTGDEYNNVYPVILEGAQKAGAIIKSNTGRMSKGKQLKALLNSEEGRVKLLITAEQFTLYTQKKQQLIAYYRNHLKDEKLVFTASK